MGSLGIALLLSIALSVPGEELFWRGFFQGQLASSLEGRTALAAVLAWVAFVLANLPSANLAIAAGAVVGGAAWVALTWWTGGVLASPRLPHRLDGDDGRVPGAARARRTDDVSDVVPAPVRRILEEGAFCHVASLTPYGPHVTPMVFASAAGRVWVTTSRGSVKARAWRRDPRVAGLVRSGDRAAAFTGTVTTYDLLDTDTWGRSLAGSRARARGGPLHAEERQVLRRLRGGRAPGPARVDAAGARVRRDPARTLGDRGLGTTDERVGDWGDTLEGVERFRASNAGASPLAGLPAADPRRPRFER